MIRQTSLDAYNELKANGKANTQRGIILHCLILRSAHRIVLPLSRTELSDLLNIRINAICGRVKELLDDELVEEVSHKCSITNNNVNGIKAVLLGNSQKDLF